MQNLITITPAALQHLRASLEASPANTIGIRFGLRDAGCSGYAYTIDFSTTHSPAEDHLLDFDGLSLIVAKQHLPALNGTRIDYVQQGLSSILVFNNPNVVDQCGCGESFKFKDL